MKILLEETYDSILNYKNLKDKPSYSSYCANIKLDRHTLAKWLKRDLNYDVKKNGKVYFFDEKEKEIINIYSKRKENKMSIRDIERATGSNNRKIQNLASLCDLDKTNYSLKQYNRGAFENILTEEQAYWLGFITADGYVNDDRGYFSLCLGAVDKEHLIKFCKFMKMPEEVIKDSIKPARGGVGQIIYYVMLSSRQLTNDLNNLKVFQRKSTKEIFNTDIPEELYSHYMRGYFDGDGCIRSDLKSMGIVSSENFCKKYKEILEQKIPDLEFDKKYKYISKKQGALFSFVVSDKKKMTGILNFLYKDANIYLDRKHELYLKFVEKYCRG